MCSVKINTVDVFPVSFQSIFYSINVIVCVAFTGVSRELVTTAWSVRIYICSLRSLVKQAAVSREKLF